MNFPWTKDIRMVIMVKDNVNKESTKEWMRRKLTFSAS